VLGDRPAAVGRELTKVFEEITRGTLAAALASYRTRTVKGELTIAIAGFAGGAPQNPDHPETPEDEEPDSSNEDEDIQDEKASPGNGPVIDEVSSFEPQASHETSSPGHRGGWVAQTHDRRGAPVASRTQTSSNSAAGEAEGE